MSYNTVPTFEANYLGVRRLRSLSGYFPLSGLGDVQSAAAIAVAQGFIDQGTADYLIASGATEQDFIDLSNRNTDLPTLMNKYQGTLSPSNPASPANPIPTTISTVYGLYDLSQQAAWDSINSLFVGTQQSLTALARKLPSDPDVVSHVSDYNSKVAQWAGYYQQAFGSSPSPMPSVTLSGLGLAPILIGAAVVAGVAALVAFLYAFNQWIAMRNASIAVTAQQTQNQSALLPAYQAAVAAGNTAQASQLLQAIGATGPAPNTGSAATNWFAANWPYIVAGGLAFMFVGIVAEKRL